MSKKDFGITMLIVWIFILFLSMFSTMKHVEYNINNPDYVGLLIMLVSIFFIFKNIHKIKNN